MEQASKQPLKRDLGHVKARPWVRQFVEEYQDGRPWGYAIFEDPEVDHEEMENCMCRIDLLIDTARGAVFGSSYEDCPHFQWECLDWPEEEEEEDKSGHGHASVVGRGDGGGIVAAEEMKDHAQDYTEPYVDRDTEDEDEEDENEADDADIDMVRELPKLRAHFKWVRDYAKKRINAHESSNVDRNGIHSGLLQNVFLVIDQDAMDSIMGNSPFADQAWVWAIDPDYVGHVASMTRNGLTDEYYGYMRVRLQQLVNNFWDARHYHEHDLPLQVLWKAARQSYNHAFVSMDPEEAQQTVHDMNLGSALRADKVDPLVTGLG
ncbi:uncharacterized protein RCC_11521 [Ramularia collo-cygni]|uniref:Uncharacterized protein n=1 Tax=Ramularia collo-cygni TaxID=112498 RepID=A0A2D3V6B5_9PEZI|nr:uncharacterized protein RCC_11521 [Ramularia collo-cygni]CZT25852.1 uncharacterized protein RCC_11521 [Ramularia collo-cygni]